MVEFAYKNGHQELFKMNLFEAINDKGCRTSVSWEIPLKMIMLELEMLKEMEQEIDKIGKNLKENYDRKKSYADLKRVHK